MRRLLQQTGGNFSITQSKFRLNSFWNEGALKLRKVVEKALNFSTAFFLHPTIATFLVVRWSCPCLRMDSVYTYNIRNIFSYPYMSHIRASTTTMDNTIHTCFIFEVIDALSCSTLPNIIDSW